MRDLIDRQAAIDAICKACANSDDYVECVERRPGSTFCDEIVALRKVPSAQPEIIRCKDCLIHGVCRFEQGLGLDGYCSQAERRTDD